MRSLTHRLFVGLCLTLFIMPMAQAQSFWTADHQIAAATAAAPEDRRDGATVLGFREGTDGVVTLREGTNDMICLADTPGDDRFSVACYHEGLAEFMARGRELSAEGKSRMERFTIREQEIEAGTIKMPRQPMSLYVLSGTPDHFNPATGEVNGAYLRYVVYIPYATAESTGLSTSAPAEGGPWIMDPGKPYAHIMIVPPRN